MSKRKTLHDRAIEDLDQQILILQKAREVLVTLAKPAKLKPAKPQPVRPLLAGS